MFECALLEDHSALDVLSKTAARALRNSVEEFCYPKALSNRGADSFWIHHVPGIRDANQDVLREVTRKAGVYAIYESKCSQDWSLRYVGQTDKNGSRGRICSHLVWRNKDTPSGKFTASKFDEVQMAVRLKRQIGFSFVQIEPATLRHYVECYLIRKYQPDWNIHGADARRS